MVLTIALTATGWTLYCCLNLHFRRLLKLSSFSMIEDSIVRTKHRSKNAWSWPKLASMFLPWTIGVSHLSAMQPIQISWTFLSVLLLPYNQYYHNQNTLILWIIYRVLLRWWRVLNKSPHALPYILDEVNSGTRTSKVYYTVTWALYEVMH